MWSGGGGPALLLCLVGLVVDCLDLVEQRLGADGADVVLLEDEALVVEGLEVVPFVLLPPHLVISNIRTINQSLCLSSTICARLSQDIFLL